VPLECHKLAWFSARSINLGFMESPPALWPIQVLTAGDTIRINNQEVAVPDAPDNNVAGLIAAINSAGIPNVVATASANVYIHWRRFYKNIFHWQHVFISHSL
jgi:hypothetical protein